MKYILINIGANIAAIACIVIAGYIACSGKSGWGWFLFVGFVCHMTIVPRKE